MSPFSILSISTNGQSSFSANVLAVIRRSSRSRQTFRASSRGASGCFSRGRNAISVTMSMPRYALEWSKGQEVPEFGIKSQQNQGVRNVFCEPVHSGTDPDNHSRRLSLSGVSIRQEAVATNPAGPRRLALCSQSPYGALQRGSTTLRRHWNGWSTLACCQGSQGCAQRLIGISRLTLCQWPRDGGVTWGIATPQTLGASPRRGLQIHNQ